MPREKLNVWKYYKKNKTADNKDKVVCNFCSQTYTFPNGTRMTKHLLKCMKCPKNVQKNLLSSSSSSFKGKPGLLHGHREWSDNSNAEHLSENNNAVITDTDNNNTDMEVVTEDSEDTNSLSVISASTSSSVVVTGSNSNMLCGCNKQSSLLSFVDKLSKKEQKLADEAFARAIYAGALPLSIFSENPFWNDAFNILRPSYKPPNIHSLRKPLLEAEYSRVMKLAKEKIQNAQCLTIISDGWTNIRGDGVVNFLLATPFPVFYKAIEPGENRETGEFIGQELLKVIYEVGNANVLLIVTDNARNMQNAWNIVRSQFSHIFTIGCVAHGLSLLAKDIMKVPRLSALRNNAKTIVKNIKNKRVVLAVFRKKQEEKYGNKLVTLKMPNPTRFAGDEILFNSLKINKAALQETIISEGVQIDEAVRRVILDESFWEDITLAAELLKPIARGIKVLEGDSPNLSLVPRVLMDIKLQTINCLNTYSTVLNSSTSNTLLKQLSKRFEFCCKPIHKAAYYVDPRFRGEGLSDEDCLDCLEVIKQISNHLSLPTHEVIGNAALYKAKKGFFERPILWEVASQNDCDPVAWWQGLCEKQPMQPIASRLLQLIPTSSASERNWSTFHLIHTKKRNRLLGKRVEKLVAIRSNLYLLNDKADKKNNCSSKDCLYYRQVGPTSLEVNYDSDDQLVWQYVPDRSEDSSDEESFDSESSEGDNEKFE